MSHRVIAGRAKGKRLKMVPGDSTRPIMDRVKEALFNILGMSVIDGRVLDLFAGTGAVGIEALSRGATHATFIDTSLAALRTIRENLAHTDLEAGAEVLRADALDYLGRPVAKPFSLVYVAPPQYVGLWRPALLRLDARPQLLEPDALVVVQIDPKERAAITLKHLRAYDERSYGNTLLWFFEAPALDESNEM